MPRIRQDLIERQRRGGFVTVPEASRLSGVCERTIRTWTRREPPTVKIRKVGTWLVFVDAADLMVVAGADRPRQTDAEILAGLAADTRAPTLAPAPHPRPLRELTIHRDEESQ